MVSRTIFATIDRLCGLYSRCIKQNTIYHYGTSMILFKFPGRELTPAQINANKIDFIKEKLQNIDNINNGIDSAESITTSSGEYYGRRFIIQRLSRWARFYSR
jgi:hypothetical protein